MTQRTPMSDPWMEMGEAFRSLSDALKDAIQPLATPLLDWLAKVLDSEPPDPWADPPPPCPVCGDPLWDPDWCMSCDWMLDDSRFRAMEE